MPPARKSRSKLAPPPGRPTRLLELTPVMLETLASQLKSGQIPLPQVTISDNIATGLRVICRATGGVSYHVQYQVGDERPYQKIGDYPAMKISQARALTETIRALAAKGIDPFGELLESRVRELQAKGAAWRP